MKEIESETNTPHKRRAYAKPELTKVGLRPEEAVLGACKTAGGTVGGGAGGTCSTISCQNAGS